jgi:hypothetical protein
VRQPRNDDGTFGRKHRGWTVVLGGVLALGVAGGAGSLGAAGGTAGSASSGGAVGDSVVANGRGAQGALRGGRASRSKGSAALRARDAARTVLRIGDAARRLAPRHADTVTDCTAHAYGHVQEWLREHPCVVAYRAVFEVPVPGTDAVVLVAVAWIDMPDPDLARGLQQLLDGDQTGNLAELSRERGRYRDVVVFDGEFYDSTIDDTTVLVAQAQPTGTSATSRAAVQLARQAVAGAITD